MSTSPSLGIGDAALARSSAADAEAAAARRNIEHARHNLADGKTDAEKMAKLRQSCEGFEAMFIQKMWQGMRSSLPKDGLMHSRDEKYWQDMYDQELGKSMASAGGIGLADMMVSQLSRNLQDASEVAANMRRRPMSVEPAPLLPEQPVAAPVNKTSPSTPVAGTSVLSNMYSGEAVQPAAPDNAQAPVTDTSTPPIDPAVQTALSNMEQHVTAQAVVAPIERSSADLATARSSKSNRNSIPRVSADDPIVTGRRPRGEATAGAGASAAAPATPLAPVTPSQLTHTTAQTGLESPSPVQAETPLTQLRAARRGHALQRTAATREAHGSNIASQDTEATQTGQKLPPTATHQPDAADLLKAQFGGASVRTRL